MPPRHLAETVSRYNDFVEAGADADFDKPKPLYKIAKPPFYAAWAMPVIHDTRAGLPEETPPARAALPEDV